MPDKLTDAEITVKALKEVLETMCALGDLQKASTISKALDLINRLQAENNRKDKIYIDLLKTSSERADIISSLKAENERLKGKKQQRRTKEINFEDMKW